MDQSVVVLTRVVAFKILAANTLIAVAIWLIARWVSRVSERKEEAVHNSVQPESPVEDDRTKDTKIFIS